MLVIVIVAGRVVEVVGWTVVEVGATVEVTPLTGAGREGIVVVGFGRSTVPATVVVVGTFVVGASVVGTLGSTVDPTGDGSAPTKARDQAPD